MWRQASARRDVTGLIYGRRMYEIVRYWDEDHPDWDAEDRDFASAWRSQPKWVVKAKLAGETHVGGPVLAHSLTEAGLIDAY